MLCVYSWGCLYPACWDGQVVREWQNSSWDCSGYPRFYNLPEAWSGFLCVKYNQAFISEAEDIVPCGTSVLAIQGEDSFYLGLWPFFLQIYGNLGLLTLKSFQPQSLHSYFVYLYKPYIYFVYLYKPYVRNTWVSSILVCICPHKILMK